MAATQNICMVIHMRSSGFCYYALLRHYRCSEFAVSDVREPLIWTILYGVLLVEDI